MCRQMEYKSCNSLPKSDIFIQTFLYIMRIHIPLIILLFISLQSYAQEKSSSPSTKENETMGTSEPTDSMATFSYVGVMPKFMGGGDDMLIPYIQKNIVYPRDAQELKIKGTVYVQYIIEKDGSVSNVTIVPGRGVYPSLDQAAIDVIKNLPRWTPGYNNGVPVRVKKVSRISFN